MDGLAAFLDESFPKVFAHLESRGVQPAGAPFVRFDVIDMDRGLEIETCIPVSEPVTGTDQVLTGVFPGGRYATLIHTGPYDGLVDANAALQRWADDQGLRFAMEETEAGDRFDARVEVYLTDPAKEPDPKRWQTEVAYLLVEPTAPQ